MVEHYFIIPFNPLTQVPTADSGGTLMAPLRALLVLLLVGLGTAASLEWGKFPHRERLARESYVSAWRSLMAEKMRGKEVSGTGRGGVFGYWAEEQGLPSFTWTLDQKTSKDATWNTTDPTHPTRNWHWQDFGNDRVNAIGTDAGTVHLLSVDRGPTVLNYMDSSRMAYGGGYSYITFNEVEGTSGTEDGERVEKKAGAAKTVYTSAFEWDGERDQEKRTQRVFGLGYYRTLTLLPDALPKLLVQHMVLAPYGDLPLVLDFVFLQNTGASPLSFSHYEYWDVNRIQLEIEWVRTGLAGVEGDARRRALNSMFNQETRNYGTEREGSSGTRRYTDLSARTAVATMSLTAETLSRGVPPRTEACDIDYYPADIFLSVISGPAPDEIYGDQAQFFGNGAVDAPDAVAFGLPGGHLNNSSAEEQPAMLAMKHDIVLNVGESTMIVFAYGYIPDGRTLEDLIEEVEQLSEKNILEARQRERSGKEGPARQSGERAEDGAAGGNTAGNGDKDAQKGGKRHRERGGQELMYPDPFLILDAHFELWNNSVVHADDDEAIWRSYQVRQASGYREFFRRHIIAQGSAYLYLHGADGAPRDSAMFTLATSHTDPTLSKSTLELLLQTQDKINSNGAMTYAFTGHGMRSDALGFHKYPSDLDLFLFWAASEYITLSGHVDWLVDSSVPYYSTRASSVSEGGDDALILDHMRTAFNHLSKIVGRGAHGFLRCGDGDWDDALIVEFNPDPVAVAFSTEYGESVPNTLMAQYVLPRMATHTAVYDAHLAQEMMSLSQELRSVSRKAWQGTWYTRAWLKNALNRTYSVGGDYLDLQSQPWALLLEDDAILTDIERAKLEQVIRDVLTCPIGFTMRNRTEDIQDTFVWPAISQLFTYYTASVTDLQLHSYTSHANQFPSQWIGILGGPDGFDSSNKGGTWASPATPMTDFPISNANGPALYILAMMRTGGVRTSTDGFIEFIRPKDGVKIFSTPLMTWEWGMNNIVQLTYNPRNNGFLQVRNMETGGMAAFETLKGQRIEIQF